MVHITSPSVHGMVQGRNHGDEVLRRECSGWNCGEDCFFEGACGFPVPSREPVALSELRHFCDLLKRVVVSRTPVKNAHKERRR